MIPLVGLGTWKIPKDIAENVVYEAIVIAGFRHIDCACDYGNEIEVGKGISKALNEGHVKREDLWITSKLWNTYHKYEHVEMACRKSLDDLQLTYFDLYMIHFPISTKFVPIKVRYPPEWIYDPNSDIKRIEMELVPISETWKGMENLVHQCLSKNIGICNFNVQSIMDLMSYAEIKPYALQIENHPLLSQEKLVEFCFKNNIKVVGFSPLGSPSYVVYKMDDGMGNGLLEDIIIEDIAKKYAKTTAQILLRWNIQRGIAVIPKSNHTSRNKENITIFDFELSVEDMNVISSFNRNKRFNDPGEFCKGMGGSIPIYD